MRRAAVTLSEPLGAPSATCTREAAKSHARTILWLLDGNREVALPDDVSPVAAAFAQGICDHHAELAAQLAGLIRHTARWDPVDLAEAIMRDITIPKDSPGGETMGAAFVNYLGMAMACNSEEARRWNAETAVCLAAEAICVWGREPGRDLRHPACVNNPATLLAGARRYLAEREAADHG